MKSKRATGLLWLTGRSFGSVRGKPLQDKLADQIRRSISARVRKAIQKDQRCAAIRGRVVEVRNSVLRRSCQARSNSLASTAHRRLWSSRRQISHTARATGCIPCPCRSSAGLGERSQGKQLCSTGRPKHGLPRRRRIAFHILQFRFHTRGKHSRIAPRPQLPATARNDTGIEDRPNAQLKFLLGLHRRRVPIVRTVKIGKNPNHALLDRDLHLLLSQFLFVSTHGHAGGPARDSQSYLRNNERPGLLATELGMR